MLDSVERLDSRRNEAQIERVAVEVDRLELAT